MLKWAQKVNALIWLSDQSKTLLAVNLLSDNRAAIGGGQIFALESLKLLFPDPLVDPAVPHIIVTPNTGVNYEPSLASTTKAEHGGLGENDTQIGPRFVNSDLVLTRHIRLDEGLGLQLRAEFFVATNHPNYNLVGRILNDPAFGQVLSQFDPRELQFGLKVTSSAMAPPVPLTVAVLCVWRRDPQKRDRKGADHRHE